jgi:uncharacterized membrane protein YccC
VVPIISHIAGWGRRWEAELRQALRITVAALIAHAVALMLGLAQGYWVVITAIIVMQASLGGSLKLAGDRMTGTLAGAGIGAAAALALPPQSDLALALAIAVAVAPAALLAASRPSFRVAPVTALIVLVPVPGHGGDPFVHALDRVAEIALGNVIGIVVALTLLPSRAHGLVYRAAARVASLNAELLTALLEGLSQEEGRPNVAPLHAAIRSELRTLEAAVDEAVRERRGHLTDALDTEPILRTLYRVRHDLVMIGRAASRPLPPEVSHRLLPEITAMKEAATGALGAAAATLSTGRHAAATDGLDEALRAYVGAMDGLRAEGRTRAMSSGDVGRLYALRFAFEQLALDLRDLGDRVDEAARQGAL